MDYRIVLLSILSVIILVVVKGIRQALYKVFGINVFLEQDVDKFKSRLKYNYLKSMSFSIFYGYFLIVFHLLYQYIFFDIGNITAIVFVFLSVPVFHRIIICLGIKLYMRKD